MLISNDTFMKVVLHDLDLIFQAQIFQMLTDCFFDEDCRAKKKTMRRAERRFKSGRHGESREEWKSAQSDYRRTVDRKRSDYWRGKIEPEKNPRRLWQSIQKVCGNNGQTFDTDLTPNDFASFSKRKLRTSEHQLPMLHCHAFNPQRRV